MLQILQHNKESVSLLLQAIAEIPAPSLYRGALAMLPVLVQVAALMTLSNPFRIALPSLASLRRGLVSIQLLMMTNATLVSAEPAWLLRMVQAQVLFSSNTGNSKKTKASVPNSCVH